MKKMGYVTGAGLGKESEGRVEPVKVRVLPPGKSLDFCMNHPGRKGKRKRAAAPAPAAAGAHAPGFSWTTSPSEVGGWGGGATIGK